MNRREQIAYWGGAVLIALFSSAIIVNTSFLQPAVNRGGDGIIVSARDQQPPSALPMGGTHVRVRVAAPRRVARKQQAAPRRTASISRAPGQGYSPLIARVQRKLAKMGYRPGPVDGRLGPSTRRALMQFQRAHNMSPTGQIEPGVMAVLLP